MHSRQQEAFGFVRDMLGWARALVRQAEAAEGAVEHKKEEGPAQKLH